MKLYTQKPKKYKQLQPEERGQIEAYYKMGMSISGIARMLNRLKSTIFLKFAEVSIGKNISHVLLKTGQKSDVENLINTTSGPIISY